MKISNIPEGISKLLEVALPCEIEEVDVQPKNKVVDIHIKFERSGAKFACPLFGKICNVHDSKVHRIRHLDWFGYRCYLNVKVPRTTWYKGY